MNPQAQAAREHHRKSGDASRVALRHRRQRDDLIKRLRAEDSRRWTYENLAKAIGCSPELIAKIIRGA